MTNGHLLEWLINNLLTDSQLDVVPPGSDKALRFIKGLPRSNGDMILELTEKAKRWRDARDDMNDKEDAGENVRDERFDSNGEAFLIVRLLATVDPTKPDEIIS